MVQKVFDGSQNAGLCYYICKSCNNVKFVVCVCVCSVCVWYLNRISFK